VNSSLLELGQSNGKKTRQILTRSAVWAIIGFALLGHQSFALVGADAFALHALIPVVAQGPCLNSLVMSPREKQQCMSWTRHETAGVAYDSVYSRLLIGGMDRKLHILDAQSGNHLKTLTLASPLLGTPVIDGEHLFLGQEDGFVSSYALEGLVPKWQVSTDGGIRSPIVAYADRVIVLTGAGTLYAFSREDGQILWTKKRPLPTKMILRTEARPLIYTDKSDGKAMLAIGHASGHLQVYELETGEVAFESFLGDSKFAFPDVVADVQEVGGLLAAASYNNGLMMIDPETRTQLFRIPETGLTRLLVQGNTIYAAGAGKVIAVDAKSGKILWRFIFDQGSPTRLKLVTGDRIAFGSERGGLFILDRNFGRPLQVLGSEAGYSGEFGLSTDFLYALSRSGTLYLYQSR